MWVVKLGGSLMGTPALDEWLEMLANQNSGKVVIVPGGGPFADAVRAAQSSAGFDDAAAHRMALLAMEQFGLAMQSLQPALAMVASEPEISERLRQHPTVIWMSSQMVLADEAIPQRWDVTSDSLAAWLCVRIGAQRLVLVKHGSQLPSVMPVDLLMADGVVDAAFGTFAGALSCPIDIVDHARYADFSAALAGGEMPGTRIT